MARALFSPAAGDVFLPLNRPSVYDSGQRRQAGLLGMAMRWLEHETLMHGSAPSEEGEGGSALERALLSLFEGNQPHLYECIEQTVLRAAFRYCERNQLQTARLLGISRNV